jgi:hypothetical protein
MHSHTMMPRICQNAHYYSRRIAIAIVHFPISIFWRADCTFKAIDSPRTRRIILGGSVESCEYALLLVLSALIYPILTISAILTDIQPSHDYSNESGLHLCDLLTPAPSSLLPQKPQSLYLIVLEICVLPHSSRPPEWLGNTKDV